VKDINQIKLEIARAKQENELNKDRLEHFKGDIEKEEMYTGMIERLNQRILTLRWVLDFEV